MADAGEAVVKQVRHNLYSHSIYNLVKETDISKISMYLQPEGSAMKLSTGRLFNKNIVLLQVSSDMLRS